MAKILPVIMCGGSGTRVWPESRESLPKQFIPLIGDRSTFQSIITVVGDAEVFERPVVITNFDYRFRVAEQLKEVGCGGDGPARARAARQRRCGRRGGGMGGDPRPEGDRGDPRRRSRVPEREAVRRALRPGGRRGGGRRDRHLRRDAGSSGDRLRVHSTRRTACRGSEGPPRRTVCREAGRGARKDLHRGGLPVEFRQFRVPRRHHAGGTEPVRAQDRRGDRRGRRPRQGGSRLYRSGPRRLRPGAAHLDRLCGDGANAPRGGARGRRRLVGRRTMVDGVAAEPAGRRRQQPARPGGGDRIRQTCWCARTSIWPP